jgi:hypothetical protein
MEMQQRRECVIDWFGISYDGTEPSIMFACDETWLGLFAVAPPNPPALESAERPDGRLCLVL